MGKLGDEFLNSDLPELERRFYQLKYLIKTMNNPYAKTLKKLDQVEISAFYLPF